jgi:hypothetical protein
MHSDLLPPISGPPPQPDFEYPDLEELEPLNPVKNQAKIFFKTVFSASDM